MTLGTHRLASERTVSLGGRPLGIDEMCQTAVGCDKVGGRDHESCSHVKYPDDVEPDDRADDTLADNTWSIVQVGCFTEYGRERTLSEFHPRHFRALLSCSSSRISHAPSQPMLDT